MEAEEARGGDKPGGCRSDILVDSDGNNVTKQTHFWRQILSCESWGAIVRVKKSNFGGWRRV